LKVDCPTFNTSPYDTRAAAEHHGYRQ